MTAFISYHWTYVLRITSPYIKKLFELVDFLLYQLKHENQVFKCSEMFSFLFSQEFDVEVNL